MAARTTFLLSLSFMALGTALVTACADGDSDEAGEEADIRAGSVALENEPCGSDVAIRKRCKSGLVCARRTGAPISEHTPGICKKPATGACEGRDLPACPDACLPEEHAGAACYEGKVCGNEIGDSCRCAKGAFQCTVHAPLGQGCNLVCLK
jgi:hypothetical protein